MCIECVIEEAGPPETWPERTPLMEAVSDAIADLYQQDGCAGVGPLHIVVDDFNAEDHSILWCLTQDYSDDYDERTWNIVHAIAWGLLSIDWGAARMVAIHDAHALGWVTA